MHWSCCCRAAFGEQGEGRSSTGPTVYQQILCLTGFYLGAHSAPGEKPAPGSNAQAQILRQDVEIKLVSPGMEFLIHRWN